MNCRSPDARKLTVLVEVGLSEDYTSLCRSKDLWIDGHGVNVYASRRNRGSKQSDN
ncbi:hypothetical protein V1525DRAFT_410337 [Lipomyces kononenkoae]|uniref:Uncharacterized protein n=1 Tax=Lipomyces kononenkoae TaxID=34357 RepID=A0ACC3SVH2_LIPKO